MLIEVTIMFQVEVADKQPEGTQADIVSSHFPKGYKDIQFFDVNAKPIEAKVLSHETGEIDRDDIPPYGGDRSIDPLSD